jgi:hypothetical protein
MMWLVEYAHCDVLPDGRKQRRFNTFYLGVPDQALTWQIAERYIELIGQQHPHAALYAVRQVDNSWERAITEPVCSDNDNRLGYRGRSKGDRRRIGSGSRLRRGIVSSPVMRCARCGQRKIDMVVTAKETTGRNLP